VVLTECRIFQSYKDIYPIKLVCNATATHLVGFFYALRTDIPQTTLNDLHTGCWRLIIHIVHHSTYFPLKDGWLYGNNLNTICQSIHCKKSDVVTQLLMLSNKGYIEIISHQEMITDAYILCNVNIPLIYK